MKPSKHNDALTNEANLSLLLRRISSNEKKARRNINLVASENVLSPLAQLPFMFDLHTRYFLDDLRRFNKWYFPNGVQINEIEQDLLVPLLAEMSGANYVNVKAISGMNCMTIALAAMTQPGDTIFVLPVEHGGHISTAFVAQKLALKVQYIPFANTFDIDLDLLKKKLQSYHPRLLYIDQANFLFPIDPFFIRCLVDEVSPETVIHYDSSHANGLILGKSLFNPLDHGAHCYGGSTHKTLPGPHKGFLATRDQQLAAQIEHTANHFVSHHQPSNIISLAITIMEMKWCGGQDYAKQVMDNTQVFAHQLAHNGFHVAAADRGYTACHQVWAYPEYLNDISPFFDKLIQMGIITNRFDSLPGISNPALRLSLSEVTKLGATTEDAKTLANIISDLYYYKHSFSDIKLQIEILCKKLSHPQFCYPISCIENESISQDMTHLCEAIFLYNKEARL